MLSFYKRSYWKFITLSTTVLAFRPAFPLPFQTPSRNCGATSTTMSAAEGDHNFVDGPPMQSGMKNDPNLPTMIVFDLDDCLWTPEMHTLPRRPSIPVQGDLGGNGQVGVVGLKCGKSGPTVQLFPGALQALRRLATDPAYKGIILAAASSSLEPSYSDACLEQLEVLPGLTVDQMLSYCQIGRTGRLTSDKRGHFRLLHQESGVAYEEMLFYDDDNWGPNTDMVQRAYGVIGQRTPNGMTLREFDRGLERYRKHAQAQNNAAPT